MRIEWSSITSLPQKQTKESLKQSHKATIKLKMNSHRELEGDHPRSDDEVERLPHNPKQHPG
ncbi:hypothetical protein ACES2L_05265 [Bdellovibrio bacteriovorus]